MNAETPDEKAAREDYEAARDVANRVGSTAATHHMAKALAKWEQLKSKKEES